jgi:hypothetical protein
LNLFQTTKNIRFLHTISTLKRANKPIDCIFIKNCDINQITESQLVRLFFSSKKATYWEPAGKSRIVCPNDINKFEY